MLLSTFRLLASLYPSQDSWTSIIPPIDDTISSVIGFPLCAHSIHESLNILDVKQDKIGEGSAMYIYPTQV